MTTTAKLRELRAVSLVLMLMAVLAPGALAADQPFAIANRPAIDPGLGSLPPQVVRSSPAATWRSFLNLGAARQFGAAAHLLDLTEVPADEQIAVGSEIAEKLYAVLQKLGVDRADVQSEDPVGPKTGSTPVNFVVVKRFQRPEIGGEIWLRRTKDEQSGELAWLFTRQTVSATRLWYQVLVENRPLRETTHLNSGLGPVPVEVRRGNPRQAVTGFLEAVRDGEFGIAAHYLDLDSIQPAEQPDRGRRLARRLGLVLQRGLWVDPKQISNDPGGAPQVGVPADEQQIATIPTRSREIDVLLDRHVDPDLGVIWTFAPTTVADVDALYAAHGYGWIGDNLPASFFSTHLLGLQLWQWIGIVLIILLGWVLARIVGHLLVLVSQAVVRRTKVTWDDELVKALDGPLGFILWGFVLAVFVPFIGLSPAVQLVGGRIWKVLVILGVGWFGSRLLDAIVNHLRVVVSVQNPVVLSFVPILQRLGKLLVFFVLVLSVLSVVGVNVMAALAGLGLGGLAVAFAAQKTLENMFGALAIAADRPFKVGDFVAIGDITGTIEDVGLRSTKIRTLQRTVVNIPNSTVVGGNIINFAARDRIFYNFTVGVVYGTTVAQLTYIIDEIRRLLLNDPRVALDGQRTRLKGFGASSIDIEVFSWIATTDYNEYTRIAEELNFRIMEIVERSGSSFAFPSRTVYVARDGGLDGATRDSIAAEMDRRRESGELVVPEPSEEQLSAALAERQRRGGGAAQED